MTRTRPTVLLEAVDVDIDGKPVLRAIDLALYRGQHMGIVGENGSGKSTLLALIAGQRWPAPRRGRRTYDFGRGPERDAVGARRRIALLGHELQDLYRARNWNFRSRDVVLSGLTRSDIPQRNPLPSSIARAEGLLESMDLAALAARRFLELSRGEQRRVLIARALAFEPVMLLLDEPASGLDFEARAALDAMLTRIAETTQIVTAAHRADQLPSVTRTLVQIDRGRITDRGRDRADAIDGGHVSAAGTGHVFAAGTGHVSAAGAGHAPAGTHVPQAAADEGPARRAAPDAGDAAAARDREIVIEVENASVWLGEREILERIDWRLRAGEHWLVTGDNGAGKSTFLRLLHGQLRPALGGSIRWPGLGDPRDVWTLRRQVALVSAELQAGYLYPSTVFETIASGFRASIGLTHAVSPTERAQVESLLAAFELDGVRQRRLRTLSYGQRHRALIARTLCTEPRLVLLDEPWEGLDSASAALVTAELVRRMRAGALQIVCASHLGPGDLPLNRFAHIGGRKLVELRSDPSAAIRDNADGRAAPRGNSASARRRGADSRPR